MRPGKPPFRAGHIGSLLRPLELQRALEAHERGEIGDGERREIEDCCICEVVALQMNGRIVFNAAHAVPSAGLLALAVARWGTVVSGLCGTVRRSFFRVASRCSM